MLFAGKVHIFTTTGWGGNLLRVDFIQAGYLAAALNIPLKQFLSEIDWSKADLSPDDNHNQ